MIVFCNTTMFSFLQEVQVFGKGNPYKIIAVDCGIKQNIIRNLVMVRALNLNIYTF